MVSPRGKEFTHELKLEFDCTNNVAEYEALLLGLDAARKMAAFNFWRLGSGCESSKINL